MPPRRRVSLRQIEILVEFAESHRDVALGRFPGGPQAVQTTREIWHSIALQLNSVADGTTKTPEQWRRYWIEFKAKTKAKGADSRRSASATGGGPNKLAPLTHLEERVLGILGPVAVEGLPGVRVPFNIPSVDETPGVSNPVPIESQSPSNSFSHPEPLMEVEWLEEDIPFPLVVESSTFTPMSQSSPPQVVNPGSTPVSSREDRPEQQTVPARESERSQRRLRTQRQIRRDPTVPRWPIEIESRRIAVEERHAAAMEELVQLIRDIRDDIRTYTN